MLRLILVQNFKIGWWVCLIYVCVGGLCVVILFKVYYSKCVCVSFKVCVIQSVWCKVGVIGSFICGCDWVIHMWGGVNHTGVGSRVIGEMGKWVIGAEGEGICICIGFVYVCVFWRVCG